MGLLKDTLHNLIYKLHGEDPEDVERQVQEVKRRVEGRRQQRLEAGVRSEYRKGHTAQEYEEWMNLND